MNGGDNKPFTHCERSRRESKGHKRKLSETGLEASQQEHNGSVADKARQLVATLRSARESGDASEIREAAQGIASLAKSDDRQDRQAAVVDALVSEGALDALISVVLSSVPPEGDATGDDVLKELCNAVVGLAINEEYAQRIGASQFLSSLVQLLKQPFEHGMVCGRYVTDPSSPTLSAARRAAEAISSLSHLNHLIKDRVRIEGGIEPLVKLLECQQNVKVQKAAASALKTLAFRNEKNKRQIVEFKALKQLIFLLKVEDQNVHPEAIGVISNLVHSTPEIKRQVLEEGVLQPVIDLLSSGSKDSQREAALLLGQFAAVTPAPNPQANGRDGGTKADFYKVRIVQRGAVKPLIDMLGVDDNNVREMAAFALGRLAQNADNQAGIAKQGALKPLLSLLDSPNDSLQHNAAFALYGLAESEDNVVSIIREGGVRRLKGGDDLNRQQSKDCVAKTVTRLESKMEIESVREHLLYLLHYAVDPQTQEYVATALAHLCNAKQVREFTREIISFIRWKVANQRLG